MTILETERLLFRDHTLEDLDAYCALEADPDVRRFVGGQPRTREAAERKFRNAFLRPARGRLRLWATVYKPDRLYIGYCGVYPHLRPGGPIPGEGSLGFTLAPPYWRRGLATEAARAFVEFGFGRLRLRRIVASVQVGNAASVHILESLGFRLARLETINGRSFYHLRLDRPAAAASLEPSSVAGA